MSITMKDIADRLNISRATVSYVLSGQAVEKKISKKTAERITSVAKDMGYTINAAAQVITSNRSKIIGLLISGDYKVGFILEMINEFSHMLIQHGYIPCIMNFVDQSNYEHCIRKCFEQRMSGIVVIEPSDFEANFLMEKVRKHDIATVFVHSRHEGVEDGIFIYSDDYTGGRMIAEHLLALGHKKIAYVNSSDSHHNTSLRLQGFIETIEKANIKIPNEFIWHVYTEDLILEQKAINILRDTKSRPTAVACFSDTAALEVMQHAHRLNISIPKELSVTGFADMHFAKKLQIPLTTVKQNFKTIGNTAFKLLFDEIKNLKENSGQNHGVTFNVPVELIVRSSTAIVDNN